MPLIFTGVITPGQIWEWSDGIRYLVDAKALGATDLWFLRKVDLPLIILGFDESEILHNASPTYLQPGQIWHSSVSRENYKIINALPHREWEMQRLSDGEIRFFHEGSLLQSFTQVIATEWDTLAKTESFGPHTCTECGSPGAQILFQFVDCINPTCRHYRMT